MNNEVKYQAFFKTRLFHVHKLILCCVKNNEKLKK